MRAKFKNSVKGLEDNFDRTSQKVEQKGKELENLREKKQGN